VQYFFFTTILFLVIAILLAAKSRHVKRHKFSNPFVSDAIVERALSPLGSILIDGEIWLARSADNKLIPSRTRVAVIKTEDHLLVVTPLN